MRGIPISVLYINASAKLDALKSIGGDPKQAPILWRPGLHENAP
jgi:hypothetical protein